jgi:hypothetical protein
MQCQRCGANVQVPPQIHVLSARCTYCGLEQPVPDAAQRQQQMQQQQHSAQIQASINQSMQGARSMTKWIMIGTFVFIIIVFAATLLPMLGVFSFGGD